MRLPKFRYMEPESIQEASTILLDEPGAKFLAGGTDILPNMKHRVELPSVVVNIKKIPDLDFIHEENGVLRIGALTSLKKIYQNESVKEKLPALASAACSVGSYHHQNMGTIGGNLCQRPRCVYFRHPDFVCRKKGGKTCFAMTGEHRYYHSIMAYGKCAMVHPSDMAPSLVALGATAIMVSPEGEIECTASRRWPGQRLKMPAAGNLRLRHRCRPAGRRCRDRT